MPFATLDPIQRRRLAVGLAVAAFVLVLAAIAIPVWLVNRHYSRTLEENQALLERYKRIAAARPASPRATSSSFRTNDPRKFFVRSGAAALSAAEAQEALRGIVEAGGGRLITMQAPNSRVDGRYPPAHGQRAAHRERASRCARSSTRSRRARPCSSSTTSR